MSFQKSLFIPLAAFLAMTIFLGFGFQLENAKVLPSALIDKPLPNFQLRDLQSGQMLRSADDLIGEVALVNVWGTWCPNCVIEHPQLLKISREQNIKIFGINYRDNNVEAKKWLKKYKDPYAFSVSDDEGTLAIDLGVYGAPETFIIDKSGFIRKRHVGPVNAKVWKEELKPLVDHLRGLEE